MSQIEQTKHLSSFKHYKIYSVKVMLWLKLGCIGGFEMYVSKEQMIIDK